MGWRSIALIAVLVFGVLFSLLYLSSFLLHLDEDSLYKELESKRVDASIYMLRSPQDICFELDSEYIQNLDQEIERESYKLSHAIENAYGYAQEDKQREEQVDLPAEYFEQMGNLYTGQGMYYENGKSLVQLIKDKKFNQTVEHKEIQGYVDAIHTYECNFGYNGDYYRLYLRFYSLRYLDEYSGFLPIHLDRASSEEIPPSSTNVYHPFNDTIVWTNNLHSPVTLDVSYKGYDDNNPGEIVQKNLTFTLEPSQSRDEMLNRYLEYYNDKVEPNFNYTVREFPSIHGTITMQFYPSCHAIGNNENDTLTIEKIRDYYSVTNFPLKLPEYIPSDFDRVICMMSGKHELMLYFWNQTFGKMESRDDYLKNGALMYFVVNEKGMMGESYTPENTTKNIIESYNDMAQQNHPFIRPELVNVNNGKLALGKEMVTDEEVEDNVVPNGNIVYVYDRDLYAALTFELEEGVEARLEGRVPLDELVKMARSLE